MLNGWKTYIVIAIGIIFNGLVSYGIIDEGLRETINAILVFFGLGTIRHGITTTMTDVTGKRL